MQINNYVHYATNISQGLQLTGNGFELNQKEIVLYSGSIQYYRIARIYWRSRLQQMRLAGLNTIETNVPWSLHEPKPGLYEFGHSSTDFQHLLDIEKFLVMARQEDLFAVVRIGAAVDYGLDNGGLPSWVNKFRSNKTYLKFLQNFTARLLLILGNLQFGNSGPIIGFYIEDPESMYLEYFAKKSGLNEFIFNLNNSLCPGIVKISDIPKLKGNSRQNMKQLQQSIWKNPNLIITDDETVLDRFVSYKDMVYVNFYAFSGGTTFGFWNGANFRNSYDFQSPISETGIRRRQYFLIQNLILNLNIPSKPNNIPEITISRTDIKGHITLKRTLDRQVTFLDSESLLPMEELPIYNNSGQSYGYIIYRKSQLSIPFNSQLSIKGDVYDNLMILLNGAVQTISREYIVTIGSKKFKNATLDIIIENSGRSGHEKEYKGLWRNQVILNNITLINWKIFPLEFTSDWTNNLKSWGAPVIQPTPSIYLCTIDMYALNDLFLDMSNWKRGIVIINSFVISRYDTKAGQRAVYLPKPYLRIGENELVIFELFEASALGLNFMRRKEFDFAQKAKIENFFVSSTGKNVRFKVTLLGVLYLTVVVYLIN